MKNEKGVKIEKSFKGQKEKLTKSVFHEVTSRHKSFYSYFETKKYFQKEPFEKSALQKSTI